MNGTDGGAEEEFFLYGMNAKEQGLPTISPRKFGRVLVMLGANGSGKSRLLRALAKQPIVNGSKRYAARVEGGRAIKIPSGSQSRRASRKYTHEEELPSRVQLLLGTLEQEKFQVINRYKDALFNWHQHDSAGELPVLGTSLSEKLVNWFNRLMPHLQLTLDWDRIGRQQPTLGLVERNGVKYPIAQLSDGEKQVLFLLADIGCFAPLNSLIIVDEPELNLNPQLAIELWELLEQERPDSVFVYATHCLSFAMRQTVTDVVILGAETADPIHLANWSDWSRAELRPFLGSIPGLVVSQKLLVVEGETTESFDRRFYSWLTGKMTAVTCVGNCDSVISAVKHEGVWTKVGSASVCGLVDRDYRTDEQLAAIQRNGCEVLTFHEWESYLCHPALLSSASRYSGQNVSIPELTDYLVALCRGQLIRVVMRRTIAATETSLRIGTRGNWPKDSGEARRCLQEAADSELQERGVNYGQRVVEVFDAQYSKCEDALNNRDVRAILQLFPGKEITKPLAKKSGFMSFDALLSSVVQNWNSPKKVGARKVW